MATRILSAGKVILLASLARSAYADCDAFGVDFQDGGSYFQNSLSSDPFTFVSQFSGCQNDTATNVFVDPNGDQVQCSATNLLPDNTNELSTCPTLKNQLLSGDWSILVLSNNGDGAPLALQRDFSLSVGPQATTTFTPTITAPVTITPVVNSTTTTTDTSTTTLPPATTTVPSTKISPTTTVTPSRVTVYSTKVLFSVNIITPTLAVIKVTNVVTASCHTPGRAATPMKLATIIPTVGPIKSLPTANSAKFRRGGRIQDKAAFIAERRAYLAKAGALVKRAPDQPTLTITDTNTADFITVTSTVTASTTTATITTTVQTTATVTPAPITLISGKTTLSKVTITAPTPTRVINRYTVATNYITRTYSVTVTITSTTTPAALATSCKKAGGIIF